MKKSLLLFAAFILLIAVSCKKKKGEDNDCSTATVSFHNTMPDPLTVEISRENETNPAFTSVALSFPVAPGATIDREIPIGPRLLRWKYCSATGNCTNIHETEIDYGPCATGFESAETYVGSDARFKHSFARIESAKATDKLMRLNPLSYLYDFNRFPRLNAVPGRTFGFVAQELEEVFPETVIKDKDGMRSVNYTALIPVLTAVLQQQQHQIERLTVELNELKALQRENLPASNSVKGTVSPRGISAGE